MRGPVGFQTYRTVPPGYDDALGLTGCGRLPGRRQEEFPEEYLWSGSKQLPDLLPDVLRCRSALNAKTDFEFWCPSIIVIVKLLKHTKERSACPRQRLAIRGRQLST